MYPQFPAGSNNQVPIGMLIAEVTFFEDDSAELFGFWYYKGTTLPETREEKRLIWTDYAIGRCCRLKLIGDAKQIEDVLLTLEWNPSIYDNLFPSMDKIVYDCPNYQIVGPGKG